MPGSSDPSSAAVPSSAIAAASEHLGRILEYAIEHSPEASALVVWDADSELSAALATAYQSALPGATFLQFDSANPDAVRPAFEELSKGDLAVLIQSTSFRLNAFRIRLELFKRSLKVIEHPHLARMRGPEALVYLDALAYDPAYFRGVGHALKARIDAAQSGSVDSGGEQLTFPVGFEPAKLNIGDYRGMPNVGGQYPIGEVFTESRELSAVNGRVRISFFGDTSFRVNRPPQPITLIVEQGRIANALDATPEFERVLAEIRDTEGEVWIREFGLGMNRAMSQTRTVSDIGTFERMCGVHLSIGSKHATYNKPEIRKKTARFHVDVFALTESVVLDDEVVFRDGAWQV